MDQRLILLQQKIQRTFNSLESSIKHNGIRAFWFIDVFNFGDLLVPFLLKSYGLAPIHTLKQQSDVICIGSILQDLKENYRGYILGSGLICDKQKKLPQAHILALRGKLTRDRLGAPSSTILGDPGLLIEKLGIKKQEKKFVLGIVPHFKDKNDLRIRMIQDRYPKEVKIIDVQRLPNKVIEDIDKCQFIFSSSLHGIVTADALGIPNAWLLISEKTSGTFKYYDYASACDMEIHPIQIKGTETLNSLISQTHVVNPYVYKIKSNLDRVFKLFAEEILTEENTP